MIKHVTYQHVNVIRARFCLYDLYLHLTAQLSQYFSNISSEFLVYYFSSVFRCKYNVILTTTNA